MTFKTLHITNAWHETSGGIATFYRALLGAARGARRNMTLVVPAAEDAVEDWGEGVHIRKVRSHPAPVGEGYRMLSPHEYLLPRGRIARILQCEKPDLVEVCDKYTLPWLAGLLRLGWGSRSAPRPTVIGLDCERMDDNVAAYLTGRGPARRLCRTYMKWFYFPMCDHHVAVSDYVAEELEAAARGHKVRRGVWVCPMGVDAVLFRASRRSPEVRARLLAQLGWPKDTHLLLYAGRLAPEKNLWLLPDCIGELADAHFRLLIAGDGPLRAQLQRESERRALGQVFFLGHVGAREELADLYANCDVFVHPNPREPFGIAPLEAMASGIPLLAPRSGGVTSFAHDGNAWLVPPAGAAFAAAVRSIVSHPETRAAKLANAQRTAREHCWPAIADGFLRLYHELHLLRQGRLDTPAVAARFYSTPGDLFGREIADGGHRRWETNGHATAEAEPTPDDSGGIHRTATHV